MTNQQILDLTAFSNLYPIMVALQSQGESIQTANQKVSKLIGFEIDIRTLSAKSVPTLEEVVNGIKEKAQY